MAGLGGFVGFVAGREIGIWPAKGNLVHVR
jgi:hypothetical protein